MTMFPLKVYNDSVSPKAIMTVFHLKVYNDSVSHEGL